MVENEKIAPALRALQGVLIRARSMAYENVDHELIAQILDSAEELPELIACAENKTTEFAESIEEISEEFQCGFVMDRWNGTDKLTS